MSRDFKYDIRPEAYAVFKSYIEIRTELGYFSNACTVRIAMDRARMNTTIRTFEMYAQGVNGGVCTVEDLKSIRADDFQVLVDDIFNANSSKRIFA